MVWSLADCEEFTTIKGKTTIVLATCQSSMNVFMWSVFSILMNTRVNSSFEHFIVSINGPDKRTGDPTLQDNKQKFLEELRNVKWSNPDSSNDRDMPITVIRVHSRVGHSQSLDMGIPWVHTEAYTIMHDDCIINDIGWTEKVFTALDSSPNVGLVYAPPLLSTGLSYVKFNESYKINLPHLNSVFATGRKKHYIADNTSWSGYHIQTSENLLACIDYDKFLEWHKNDIIHVPPKDLEYKYLSMDIGTIAYYKLKKAGYSFVSLPQDTVTHLTAMSWGDENSKSASLQRNNSCIANLESKIMAHPVYSKIFTKYKI